MLSSKPSVTVGIAPGPTCEMPGADGAGGLDPAIRQHVMDNNVTIELVFKLDGKEILIDFGSGWFVAGTEGSIVATAEHIYSDAPEFVRKQITAAVYELADLNQEKFEKLSDLEQESIQAKIDSTVAKVEPTIDFRARACGGDQKGESFDLHAEPAATDEANDVAIFRLESPQTDYTGLTFAPEGSVQVLDKVWVTGITGSTFPCGIAPGHVSIVDPDMDGWIVIAAPVNPANSGGAAVNAKGEVIGLAAWKPLTGLGPADSIAVFAESEKVKKLVEPYQQEIRENSMANEPTEEELSAWFMDVDELPDIADIKVQDLGLDAVPRDTRLRPDALEGLELRSSFIEGNEASIVAGLSPDTGIVPGISSLVPGILDTTDIIDGDPLDAGLLFG